MDQLSEGVYRQRAEIHTAEQQRYARQSSTISYCRVATFLLALACLVIAAMGTRLHSVAFYSAAGFFFVAFFVLVGVHSTIESRERHHAAFVRINELALAKLHRTWDSIPVPDVSAPPLHDFAEDLDLFGRASLFALLWSGGTGMGRDRLAEWLLKPASPSHIRERQEAVEELAPLIDLRQQLLATAINGSFEAHDVVRFLDWVEGPVWLSHPLAEWSVRGLTASIVALIALQAAGVVSEAYWLAPVAIAFVVSNLFAKRIFELFDRAFAHHKVFIHYSRLFAQISSAEFRSPHLKQIQEALRDRTHTAAAQMSRLDRLMQLGDLRHSALLHFPVQMFTLWDFHVILAVERWQRHVRQKARQWFDAAATFEALASLAALRFDNPGWAMPTIEDHGDTFEASLLGHPLLPAEHRVDNDVRVGPRGTFLLVTGSNMSGKSTLLRAIGVNAVLAQAGGPVCAVRLRMPPVRLHTSMRVQDSLEHGVSFFMAAVQRLKQVVEAAESPKSDLEPRASDDALLLYLLDEVLQGTNTAERQIAVRRILEHLLERPAIGAVTTHDLTLAETRDLAGAADAVHFTEHIDAGADGRIRMTFDYRLRPGLATSHNALRLMQMVGLEVKEHAGE